ncbi:hypothetical protein IG631_09180 [Alternaria alternata]|nr:hypothetical protein IG631_09180 [Alternaria alternata]
MVPALASLSIDTTLAHPSYRYFRIELRRVVAADLALFLYFRYRRKSRQVMIKHRMASVPTSRRPRLRTTPSQYWVKPNLPRVVWQYLMQRRMLVCGNHQPAQ